MDAPEPNTIGGALAWIAGTLSAAWGGWAIIRRTHGAQNVTDASNEANIEAINTYRELVATERAARQASDARADKFAEERNEAWKQLYATQGKLEAMADQVMSLNNEISLLRGEVAQLRATQLKGA